MRLSLFSTFSARKENALEKVGSIPSFSRRIFSPTNQVAKFLLSLSFVQIISPGRNRF